MESGVKMVSLYECDRCGQTYKFFLNKCLLKRLRERRNGGPQDLDLCNNCDNELNNWMNKK